MITRQPQPGRFAAAFSMIAVIVAGLCVGCSTHNSDTDDTATTADLPASLEPNAPPPPGLSCADIGGVFVPHGTDGRGDCMSTDPRPACHVAPENQDGNYIAEMTMTPPFTNGTIDSPEMLREASNKQCWKVPVQ